MAAVRFSSGRRRHGRPAAPCRRGARARRVDPAHVRGAPLIAWPSRPERLPDSPWPAGREARAGAAQPLRGAGLVSHAGGLAALVFTQLTDVSSSPTSRGRFLSHLTGRA